MDSQEMMNLVGSEVEGNPAKEHSKKETMTPESRHSQQKSDASIAKASSPCKETESTNRSSRPLRSETGTDEGTPTANKLSYGISPQESTKGTGKEAVTTNESRSSLPIGSDTGNDEGTTTTNKSSNGVSSSPESTMGSEEVTVTTNESKFHQLDTKFERELREQVTEISSRKRRGWSSDELEVFKHPLCLISTECVQSEDGKEEKTIFKSEQEVFEQIKQIDLPLVVVAVVGLCRSGKSYLMNCIAKSSEGGFELGSTIESKTQGIWVWCKMHPTQENTVLVLLDTEGLGDVEKDDQNHDTTIFTLATLLCNCLVYNIQTAFNSDSLSKLTFVTEMASYIRYRGISMEDNKTLNLILPIFVLRIRDFILELVKDEKTISTNEYLEECLADKEKKAAKFNKQRECIRKYFPTRACFVSPLPGDEYICRNLQHLSFDALSDSFKKATEIFVSYIYTIPPKDMSGSKPINGEMFVTLADRYVNAFKHGNAADVDDAFTAAAKIKNAKLEEEALEIFKKLMLKVDLPVSGIALRCRYTNAQQAALDYLRQNTVHGFQAELEYRTQRKMDELWNTIKEDNAIKVQQKCENTLQDDSLKSYFDQKIKNKDYETAGGYRKFQRIVEKLREGYYSNLCDFEEKEILFTWIGFIKSIRETEAIIVEADEDLTKKEKEDEQKRYQENIEKLVKEQQKAHQESLDKQRKDLEDHYKKLAEDREKQVKADHDKYVAFVKERLDRETAQKELLEKEKKERKDKWFAARMWNAFWNDD